MIEAAFLYRFVLNGSTSLTCISLLSFRPHIKRMIGFSYSIQPQMSQISLNEKCSNEPFYIIVKYHLV